MVTGTLQMMATGLKTFSGLRACLARVHESFQSAPRRSQSLQYSGEISRVLYNCSTFPFRHGTSWPITSNEDRRSARSPRIPRGLKVGQRRPARSRHMHRGQRRSARSHRMSAETPSPPSRTIARAELERRQEMGQLPRSCRGDRPEAVTCTEDRGDRPEATACPLKHHLPLREPSHEPSSSRRQEMGQLPRSGRGDRPEAVACTEDIGDRPEAAACPLKHHLPLREPSHEPSSSRWQEMGQLPYQFLVSPSNPIMGENAASVPVQGLPARQVKSSYISHQKNPIFERNLFLNRVEGPTIGSLQRLPLS